MVVKQKVGKTLAFFAVLSVVMICFPFAAIAQSIDVFFTQSEFYNVIRLSYGAAEGENWICTDAGDPSLNAVVTAHKKDDSQIGDPIAVPASAAGYVDYSAYIKQGINYLKVVFQGNDYTRNVQILNMVFRFEQLENQNKARLTTYAVWPDQSYPVSTEGGDGWTSEVKAYGAEKNELGPVDVPDSADGVADYSGYADTGIKYLRVTQGNSSSQFFEVEVYQTVADEPEPENGTNNEGESGKEETASQEQKPDEQETDKEDDALPSTASANGLSLYLSLILLAGGICLQFRCRPDRVR